MKLQYDSLCLQVTLEGNDLKMTGRLERSPTQPRIELIVFSNGERCPMLLDGMGVPFFDATVWTLTSYRHKSASTVEQALRGAMLLHLFCWRAEIDLLQRVRDGVFFGLGELEALVTAAHQPFDALRKPLAKKSRRRARTDDNAGRAALVRRLPSAKRVRTVSSQTTLIRLHYLRSYLRWLGERQNSRFGYEGGESAFSRAHDYGARLAEVLNQIKQREPSVSPNGRQTLDPAAQARLLAVAEPSSLENPWSNPFVRLRNWTIVKWLLGTGMRKGELLGLLVKDFNRGQSYCEIRRRHDDKRDPRRRQPAAKTLERLAPLNAILAELGEDYLKARSKIEAARKHGYLFVATDGKPLSGSAVTELFATLRKKFPELAEVSAHVLRHQWNENFSAYADLIGMKPEDELRERAWLMGWSANSTMPGHYLKRRTKAKADEHSRQMQERLMMHDEELEAQ